MRTERSSQREPASLEAPPAHEALEAVAASSASLPPASPAVLTGHVVRVSTEGAAWVDHPSNPLAGPVRARAAVPVVEGDVGREVVLVFEGGHPNRPIILGVLRDDLVGEDSAECRDSTAQPDESTAQEEPESMDGQRLVDVERDGERITVRADKELVLRCGEASITLTREGKVLIRGAYVSTHASGVNRVRGGSVRIN